MEIAGSIIVFDMDTTGYHFACKKMVVVYSRISRMKVKSSCFRIRLTAARLHYTGDAFRKTGITPATWTWLKI